MRVWVVYDMLTRAIVCMYVCMCAVYKEPYLLVYCESALEVYDVLTAKWVQIIPFRKV